MTDLVTSFQEMLLGLTDHAWFITLVAFVQNVSFTMVSRARNRNSQWYHLLTSIFSNSLYIATLSILVLSHMSFPLIVGYVIGTVAGSVSGVKISIPIERRLVAASDSHLKPKLLSAEERAQLWRDFSRLGTDAEKRDWITQLQASLPSPAA